MYFIDANFLYKINNELINRNVLIIVVILSIILTLFVNKSILMVQDGIEIREAGFIYQETGDNKDGVILLLHGLLGALSNFEGLVEHFGKTHNVSFPSLPIFEMPIIKLSVTGLVDYVDNFVKHRGYTDVHIVGNSLGGHIAQLYALRRPEIVKSLTLTGSSGLFENAMGSTFPKRGDYDYIKKKVEEVFFDSAIATKEYVDDLYEAVNNRGKAIRIIKTAKSAIRNNLSNKIQDIKCPTLLVWGKEDKVTPLFVGEKFNKLLPNSTLKIINKCGHAPMMERPDQFNKLFTEFLEGIE